MTLTAAWVRRIKNSHELVIISDSRLRSCGAIDQAQKIMPLQRGDVALAFCGDNDVAYPFFVQASSVINNFIRLRTRGSDVTEVVALLGNVLNNLVESWDASLPEKQTMLAETRILIAGWSWRNQRFHVGFFKFRDTRFIHQTSTNRLSRPWRERRPSLIVIGDYVESFMRILGRIIDQTNTPMNKWIRREIDLQYEPLEALDELLNTTRGIYGFHKIGGRPQVIKVYPYSRTLPIVVRGDDGGHYLFGRRLFEWEKTEHPIAVIAPGKTDFIYPMANIPVPAEIDRRVNSISQLIRFITSRGLR